jgi:pimeloyl-ACP methyl ester carboxylesterase
MKSIALHVFMLLSILTAVGGVAQRKTACNSNRLPVVYVHGFLGAGDNWALQSQRLEANGYCPERLFVFDWNTLNRQTPSDSLLQIFIQQVLKSTGARQVDLVGHSAGGGLCSRFLGRPDRAAMVAHYVHIGSFALPGLPGGVPTMNIYSSSDLVAGKAGPVAGAENVKQVRTDHLEVVTSEESFNAIFGFLVPYQKPHSYISPVRDPFVSGRALMLGENTPLANAVIEIWQHDTLSGNRIGKGPEWKTVADSLGNWKGFKAKAGMAYEFVLRPQKGRVIHYFQGPFTYHQRLLYLRGLPTGGMTAMILGGLPSDAASSAIAIFTANAAIIAGRDTLSCNGRVLSTPASKTCIALFLYDEGKDGKGEAKPMARFGAAPFLNGADIMLPERPGTPIGIHYNGRTRRLPPIPSSEGVMVAVFE